jgi:hypothetical protein
LLDLVCFFDFVFIKIESKLATLSDSDVLESEQELEVLDELELLDLLTGEYEFFLSLFITDIPYNKIINFKNYIIFFLKFIFIFPNNKFEKFFR